MAKKIIELQVDVYNASGVSTELKLSEKFFGKAVNKDILNQALRIYQANQRMGNSSSKTRAEVSGGGKKPWKQKGTGRARQGSTRAPHWRGGGIVFGPRTRDFSLKFPRKMAQQALISALSEKINNQSLNILNINNKDINKTKQADGLLKKIYINKSLKSILLVVTKENNYLKVFKNLGYLTIKKIPDINAYEVMRHQEILLTKEAMAKYE